MTRSKLAFISKIQKILNLLVKDGLKYFVCSSLALFIVFFGVTKFFYHFQKFQKTDPDYYYHVGLSKWMQEHALPQRLPQVTGIGWDRQFVDKEFLFHQLTAFAYRWAGETGVSHVPLFILFLFILTLWFALGRKLSVLKKILVTVACLLPFYWLNRMILVRPHTLGVLLTIQLCLALWTKSKFLAAIFGALFSLSYHALQIPILILMFYGFSQAKRDRLARLTGYWTWAGLIAGVLVNPYFPEVLLITWQHIQIALSMAGMEHPIYGDEVYPWTTADFVLNNLFMLGVVGVAIRAKQTKSFIFYVTLAFWGIACFVPRGQEYSIPLTALLLSELLTKRKALDRFASFLLIILGAAQCEKFYEHYRYKTSQQAMMLAFSSQVTEAVTQIPSHEKAQVLNVSWELGPYLLYHRPGLKFLDLLDPTFYLRANPEFASLRQNLNRGLTSDLFTVITQDFASRYILGTLRMSYPLAIQLENDPRFHRLFPDHWPGAVGLSQCLEPDQGLAEQVFLYAVQP